MADAMYRRLDVAAMELLRQGWALVQDRYGFFFLSTVVGLVVGSMVPFQLLTGAAMCGIQLCYLERADGREPTWETLVKGLDYFLPAFVAALLTALAFLVASLPFLVVLGVGLYKLMVANLEGTGPPFDPTLLIAGGLLAVLFGFLAQINILFFFMFGYVLIVDKGLGGFRALVVSTRAVWANLGALVGVFMLLSALLLVPVLAAVAMAWLLSWTASVFVALLAASLVSVATLPVLLGVITVAYRRIFPAEVAL